MVLWRYKDRNSGINLSHCKLNRNCFWHDVLSIIWVSYLVGFPSFSSSFWARQIFTNKTKAELCYSLQFKNMLLERIRECQDKKIILLSDTIHCPSEHFLYDFLLEKTVEKKTFPAVEGGIQPGIAICSLSSHQSIEHLQAHYKSVSSKIGFDMRMIDFVASGHSSLDPWNNLIGELEKRTENGLRYDCIVLWDFLAPIQLHGENVSQSLKDLGSLFDVLKEKSKQVILHMHLDSLHLTVSHLLAIPTPQSVQPTSDDLLFKYLLYQSDIWLEFTQLPNGYSNTVDGLVRMHQLQEHTLPEKPHTLLFKTFEKGISYKLPGI